MLFVGQPYHKNNSSSSPSSSLFSPPLRKSASYNYHCEYNRISLQTVLMIFITLMFNVFFEFSIDENDLFSIFVVFILIYAKFCTNFSLNLTYYISQHEWFLLWFFNCLYFCKDFKIAWVLIRQTVILLPYFLFWLFSFS